MSQSNAHRVAGAIIGTLVGLAVASLLVVPFAYTAALNALAEQPGGQSKTIAVVQPVQLPKPVPVTVSLKTSGSGNPAQGMDLFAMNCVACHGPDGKGRPNLGKDLVHSDFVKKTKDTDLVMFLKRGRDTSDPLNTTKVPMPPKGGNPALQDPQLKDLVAFIRQLQKGS